MLDQRTGGAVWVNSCRDFYPSLFHLDKDFSRLGISSALSKWASPFLLMAPQSEAIWIFISVIIIIIE